MASPSARQKTVLITGCTPGGIGHALCIEFQRRGQTATSHDTTLYQTCLRVIATARNVDVLSDLAQQGMDALPLDVTNKESIASCHEAVGKLTGEQLDILVNNAGRTHTHPALDLDMDDVRQTFETNVFGVMAMVAAFGDQLIAAKGLVVNIASLAAVTPYVFGSAYCASKGAVVSYSRTLRQELAPLGVRVMVGMVGTVKSNIASRGHRSLPERSAYQPIRDVFERRLVFSQTQDAMSTEALAAAMVDKALAAEVPWFLRAWVGRPDWFWRGGMASLIWWTTMLSGEWVTDYVSWVMFGLDKLRKIVQQDAAVQSSNPEDSKAKDQ
ncbi:short chain dehydrogenase/reductase [Apiospora rasikravindrae]|uniref:Short chain dehydrogenase/reductase n=1 Tax=Apiospora rasikravindrae TaxID=990691 RepID=A0ABR1SYE3_9PEZI